MDEVEALHQTKRQARLVVEKLNTEKKQADRSEWRMFRWGIIATVVTMLILRLTQTVMRYSFAQIIGTCSHANDPE